ncbi:hypothetical protein GR198_28495 [Rhizobium leguminosarum]|uniref:RNA-binding domain-containing protein n=1 Tax=Rhizobium leguminosarum TaxID=384 RepID=UPI0013C22E1C|nr:RNA-binding domain-containing protein [Rhizobium leguminosarum]NEH59667.1 hypothetical protein [Rhizobium leguminosarum]
MIQSETAAKLIDRLNEIDESEDLEAKAIKSDDPGKSLYETICALSNEPGLGGGIVLLGVTKEMGLFPHYVASGIGNPDKLSSDIVTTCNTAFNIPLRIDIEPERIGKKVVLKLIVPEVPKAQKPVYFKATGLPKGAFRRVGPSDVRCTDEDMSAFFAEQGQETPDIQIVKEASWHDIDPNAVQAYRKARREAYSGASELDMPDEDMLHALGAVKKIDGKIKVTLAGMLLFGTQGALRRLFPSHRVDYLRVSSHSWAENPLTPFEAVEIRGPLLLIASRIMATVADDLPKAFRIENQNEAQRTEAPVIPYRVVREAIINCLMHRNYRVNKPVQVIRFPNRIVIKNPGYSLKSEDRFDESGSALRNPHIAKFCTKHGMRKRRGAVSES